MGRGKDLALSLQIVWFKRDLRLHDHEALTRAAVKGPVLPLYILEPELWQQPDMSQRHYLFLLECLADLNRHLTRLGQPLVIRTGNACSVLSSLVNELRGSSFEVAGLWSHMESWNSWTFKRDRAVLQWARNEGLRWNEPRQWGVDRGDINRDHWASRWEARMRQQEFLPPSALQPLPRIPTFSSDSLPTPQELGLTGDHCTDRQKGGREEALSLLQSFLYTRGEPYTRAMSGPLEGAEACSRLSPHMAFGTLSMREILAATEMRQREVLSTSPGFRGRWPSAMRSFSGRLRWHCHFIQKLESEPDLEFRNLHPAYDNLRPSPGTDPKAAQRFTAWSEGQTGYPMIDACMRCLRATGWMNFRMRSMLMSFASYHLWLDWREPSLHLARLFTDYEPGIHYSQAQMQSATTGINAIRIYNPVKQSQDHDPEGLFIRKWVPELSGIPDSFIHQPWLHPDRIGDYPLPVVGEKQARLFAAQKLFGLRKTPEHRELARAIYEKHGSRKRPSERLTRKKKNSAPKTARPRKKQDNTQLDLPL
ncbi:deoxyribodipyrimidine photo-lyase [Kiloniella sp. b19]|uniref:deoxyribodipyrimidine photo-lyase n=1 Tax=Kiloniella sp. GXU_MW_B19 TaxID=3141326 RepID=UPI0031D3FBFC